MNYPVYGVWEGRVIDYLNQAPEQPWSGLQGLPDFAPDNAARLFIADRGFLVFDRQVNLAWAFYLHMQQAAQESCGRCTPCRVGTQRLRDLLYQVATGTATGQPLSEMHDLAFQVSNTSLCGLGQTCAKALLQALVHYRDMFVPGAPAARLAQHQFSYTTAPCIEVCPSKVDVPRYIDGVKGGKFDYALEVVLDKYSMTATCGRVCVRFCEAACRRNLAEGPVAIRMLKRYAADQAVSHGVLQKIKAPDRKHPQRVAIVGAGPAGITCAYKLLLDGYGVTVYDAQQTAGGMASIGIPSYRLPKDVLKHETEDLVRQLGGQFSYGQQLGHDFSVSDLLAQGYDAVFLGYGASQGTLLGIKNEDPVPAGYVSGVDFLLDVHKHVAGEANFSLTGDVVVVGGGNVAMDCVRSARRMGARSVRLIYRRTMEDMPADPEEIHAAIQEGIVFDCLSNPSALLVENGKVTGLERVRMQQTEKDAKGRRNVEPIPDSMACIPCDMVIAAIGQQVDKTVLATEDGIKLDRWNCVVVDRDTLQTDRPGVFAGGDCVLGPLTLVNALEHGERAAYGIIEYLQTGQVTVKAEARMQKLLATNHLLTDDCLPVPPVPRVRVQGREQEAAIRVGNFAEVELAISKESAYEEAKRCLRCYRIYSIATAKPLARQHRSNISNGQRP